MLPEMPQTTVRGHDFHSAPIMPQDRPYHPAVHGLGALIAGAALVLDEIVMGIPSARELGYKTAMGMQPTFGDYALAGIASLIVPAVTAMIAIYELRDMFRARRAIPRPEQS